MYMYVKYKNLVDNIWILPMYAPRMFLVASTTSIGHATQNPWQAFRVKTGEPCIVGRHVGLPGNDLEPFLGVIGKPF
jgi:hypothetical protein